MKKNVILLLTLAFAIGCNKGPSGSENVEKSLPINFTASIETKATETAFEAGDAVGLYVVNREGTSYALKDAGNHADNVSFVYDGSKWSPAQPIYWKDQTIHADFYCYYPYRPGNLDVTSLAIFVQMDQSVETNLKKSDFLWGKVENQAPTVNPVRIVTSHEVAKVVVTVKPGAGYTEEILASKDIEVVICNVKCDGKINLNDGSIAPQGEKKEVIPFKQNGSWYAYLIPQEISNEKIVRVKMDGNTYLLEQSVSLKRNTIHSCTITINRVEEGVNIGIGDWEVSGEDFGGTI